MFLKPGGSFDVDNGRDIYCIQNNSQISLEVSQPAYLAEIRNRFIKEAKGSSFIFGALVGFMIGGLFVSIMVELIIL